MVVKTFIAATCAAALAGGMVYFSTSPASSDGSITIDKPVVEAKTNSKPVRKPVKRTANKAEKDEGKPNILRRYVDKDGQPKSDKDVQANPYKIAGKEATSESNAKKRLVAENLHPHPRPLEEIEKAEKPVNQSTDIEDFERNAPIVSETPAESMPTIAEIDESEIELPAETDAKTVTPVKAKPKQARIDAKPQVQVLPSQVRPKESKNSVSARQQTSQPSAHHDNHDDPAKIRIETVFEQAEQIQQQDLKDRAYLDLSDYATNKGMFNDAERAALKIQQPELRDTARSRIAMGMARYGLSDEAFELIEQVEIQELRDVMRLQVIEALLGTDMRR